jgi:hypothetical protein
MLGARRAGGNIPGVNGALYIWGDTEVCFGYVGPVAPLGAL